MELRITRLSNLRSLVDEESAGADMLKLIRELFPICRSITGNGLRQSLAKLRELLPLSIHEIASGTEVFDWTIPKEWNIRDAYIKDSTGHRVVDFRQNNLHVVNYSAPVSARMSLSELESHLHSLPERPEWIPYRTTYYAESWGFCLSQRQLESLSNGEYEVLIDSSLEDGALTYGECVLPGQIDDEFLISVHICHPSLCNDNLSGVAVATSLARILASTSHRYTYRFMFVPGTIGPISWLFRNQDAAQRLKHGLVLACVGDRGSINYKRSRRLTADIDRAVEHVLRTKGAPFEIQDFSPYGYDERQYCSPGFNLPVGSFRRTPHGEYPEYHTSADNLEFVSASHLADSLVTLLEVIALIESNLRFINLSPMGEPQLGRRGLIPSVGGKVVKSDQLALLWVLNLSDGGNSVLDIAERSGLSFDQLRGAIEALSSCGLLERANGNRPQPRGPMASSHEKHLA
jgi:aminopeptidase-like protein